MNEKQILDKCKLLGATIFDYRGNIDNTHLDTDLVQFCADNLTLSPMFNTLRIGIERPMAELAEAKEQVTTMRSKLEPKLSGVISYPQHV